MPGKAVDLDTPTGSGLRQRVPPAFLLRIGAREVPIGPRALTAGRSAAAGLSLVGAGVSRRHATFSRTEDGVVVIDHASRNGVFVNGERIEGSRALRSGDVITIGDDSLTLLQVPDHPAELRKTLSDMRPVSREQTPLPPSGAQDDASVATRRADAFQLLGGVVDKALALGRGEAAEHLLGTHLLSALADATRGRSLPPEIIGSAARYALKLAAATNKAAWLDFTVRLYQALAQPMPLPLVDEMYTLVGRIRGLDRTLLASYVESLRHVADTLSPADRFVLQRLSGLEHMARVQSDAP
jgi:pSer/pThr/pTyr-binding forkhead associated (FHA) protein